MEQTKERPVAALHSGKLPVSKLTRAISKRRFRVLRPLQIGPDPENRASCYYTDDHVRALISDLGHSSSSGARSRAARKLRMLAKHCPENRLRIAAVGAVPVLVSTLQQPAVPDGGDAQSPEPAAELQEHAMTALYNLSLHDSNLPLIAASGAAAPAISTLGSPGATAVARSGAACLLLRLTQHDGSGEVLEEVGRSAAIPSLVALLRADDDPRVQKDAATTLYELTSRWAPNRARAARAGLVPVLLELMEVPGSCMVEKAAYLLSAMVEADEARAEVVECGGVAMLVDMVETGTREQREIAVNVLFRMCNGWKGGGEEYRRVVADEAAVPALLAVALPESGCSAKSRQKAKVLLEALR